MRVHLDAGAARGTTRCDAPAPMAFDVDDLDRAMLPVEGAVPPESEGWARLAASSCPEDANNHTESA